MYKNKITFITKNKRKFERAKKIFESEGLQIKHLPLDTIEIQTDNNADIVTYSLQGLGCTLKKPLVQEDVGFYIPALNGFPGPYIKYVNKWLDPKYILKLMGKIKNRKCFRQSSLGIYNPKGNRITVFTSREYGLIAREARGSKNYNFDRIFIHDGFKKTRAQFTEDELINLTNLDNWKKLIKSIKSYE